MEGEGVVRSCELRAASCEPEQPISMHTIPDISLQMFNRIEGRIFQTEHSSQLESHRSQLPLSRSISLSTDGLPFLQLDHLPSCWVVLIIG